MVNIFLVDDHPLIIEGFKKVLHDVPHFNIVGSAYSAADTFAQLSAHPSAHLVLLDLNLPDEDGIAVARKLYQEFPGIKILFLTSALEGAIIIKAMQAGANGYVLKNTGLPELVTAIDAVMRGETYISREANAALIGALQAQANQPLQAASLTRREREILLLLAQGLTSQEIARRLTLSPYTIDTHRKNMLQKFGVHNVQALVNVVSQRGLLH